MPNDFFKHNDKVYAENLNDGILVGNSFNISIEISLPTDTGGAFPSTTTTVKAKVADVTPSANANLSIGETIANTSGSSQDYRLTVYPDFNRFGGFSHITLTGSGCTVKICEKGESTEIASGLNYDDLSNVAQLKSLKEYDIVVTIPNNKTLTGLDFGFLSKEKDVTATINQEDVTGLTAALSNINGDVSALEQSKEDNANKSDDYTDNNTTNYPSSKALSDGLATKQNNTFYSITGINPDGSTSKTFFNHQRSVSGGGITFLFNPNYASQFNATLRRCGNIVTFTLAGVLWVLDDDVNGQNVVYNIPEGYRPNFGEPQVAMLYWGTTNNVTSVNISQNNEVRFNLAQKWASITDKRIGVHAQWVWLTTDDEPTE